MIEEYRQIYTRRRRIVLDTLDRLGISYGEPRGGFYVFLNAASTGMPAPELSLKLLEEAHVLIFPGTGFGEAWADYMRLAWLVPEPELTRGDAAHRGGAGGMSDFVIAWVDAQPDADLELGNELVPDGFRVVEPRRRGRRRAGHQGRAGGRVACWPPRPRARFLQKYGGREDGIDLAAAGGRA